MASVATKFPGVALITGAGGTGIGAAVALAFAQAGCRRLALTDINPSTLAATVTRLRGAQPSAATSSTSPLQIFHRAGDVSDDGFVSSLVADVAAFSGDNRIDYAVNCAGVLGPPLRSHEVAPGAFDRINGVNYRGSWLVSRAVLGRMVAQEAVVRGPTWGGGRGWGERGCVVNIASQLGIVARPEAAAYCASKSAVIGMTKADAIDYARDGIRVNCVCPGVIETPMTVGSPELAERMRPAVDIAPMRRMGTPEEAAAAVLFLCSGDASFVQGHALVVDGGYTIN